MTINSRFSNTNAYHPPLNPAAYSPGTHASGRQERSVQPQANGPYSPAALLDGFWQKWGTMNCVTVAGIKAAMQRFGGPNEVYFSVQRTYGGFDVRMRDNPRKVYHVTFDELAHATRHSGFRGNNQKILNEANFMYAVSAKRAQLENNDGYAARGFTAAVHSLDTWEHTAEGLNRLGLANYVQHTNAQDLINGAPGVMAENDHVVTVLNGRKDHYGRVGYRPNPWAAALKLLYTPRQAYGGTFNFNMYR
ncbi:hypothetical protein P5706_00890 [Pseudomonas sp. ChxA]|uniref:hypothetical protein n=1 Tax=Pseudomonas sp. ChxA TaxID=3035473 RepID=UPI002554FEFA|nr:hypothetical protein [Pseudomonas sp. ChxA]MDL2182746.1 hypothetical protein [Pseudomonas sp. ChxA]